MTNRRSAPRGQTLALGAITMLILALMVFITLNITQALHAKVNLQNYADAKAFTVAVQEARALNYFAYTNRAIASSYVAMANLHAYMAEAAILADADLAAANIMYSIGSQEYDLCYCCFLGPCCFNHCIDGFIADWHGLMFSINWITGDFGGALQDLDDPFRNTMNALDKHVLLLRASQNDVRLQIEAFIASSAEIGPLKKDNVGDAPVTDISVLGVMNVAQFNQVFLTDDAMKKRIMAEVVNATRPDFTRDRDLGWNTMAAVSALYAPATMQKIRDGAGGEGYFTVLQPTFPWKSGRTAMADGSFGGFVIGTGDVSPGGVSGNTIASYAYGTLTGQWRHGASVAPLPALGPISAGQVATGNSPEHSGGWLGDIFNSPHSGAEHDSPTIDLSRFMEFNIDTDAPYHQPAVFAAASGDLRYNERGHRSVFEVTKSGHVKYTVGAAGTGEVQLSDDKTAYGVSKALVYYHRIGDWSDYPNLFNPYWRAKLEPMTAGEAAQALNLVDNNSATLVGTMGAQPKGRAVVNLQ